MTSRSAPARPSTVHPWARPALRPGTKLDNLVHIAHGVHVGRHALLAGQVGIAGSATIEDHVMFGGQVGVAGHVTVGKGTRATAQTGIPNDVAPGIVRIGLPGDRQP